MKATSIFTWSTFVLTATVACSGDDGSGGGGIRSSTGGSTATTAPDATATGGAGTGTASGGSSSVSTDTQPDLSLDGQGPVVPGGETIDEGEACEGIELEPQAVEVPQDITTTTTYEEPAPVALYIMLDNSMSMGETATGSRSNKWEEARTALTTFVKDPASEGMDVAIQYFHPIGAGEAPDECAGDAHAVPAVAMGRLPDNAAAIEGSLRAAGMQSSTPTSGALTGATRYCSDFQVANPDENCVVVFVTDGLPNGCDLSATCAADPGTETGGRPGMGFAMSGCVDPNAEAQLGAIASAGLASGVVSFMIGMNGVTEEGFALLDALAIAGGSDCTPDVPAEEACDVSATGAEGLLAALAAIRESVTVVETHTETIVTTEMVPVPCEWTIPPSPEGEKLDPNRVNVNLVDVNLPDAAPLAMSYVGSAEECQSVTDTGAQAWYYDVADAPTKILACPATCDMVTTQTNMSVKVLFGCEPRPDAR